MENRVIFGIRIPSPPMQRTCLTFLVKATSYWTATNVADGLSALAICIEVKFFSHLSLLLVMILGSQVHICLFGVSPYTDGLVLDSDVVGIFVQGVSPRRCKARYQYLETALGFVRTRSLIT